MSSTESNKLYDVVGVAAGQYQRFATGLTLEQAHLEYTRLNAEGIGGNRTVDTGTNSGIQNAYTITDLTIVTNNFIGGNILSEVVTLHDGVEINGAATVFALSHLYDVGSVVVAATPPAGFKLVVSADDGKYIQIKIKETADENNASIPFPVGHGNVVVTYNYSDADQYTVPGSDTFRSGFVQAAVTPGGTQLPPIE